MYIPAPAADSLTSTGLLSSTVASTIATNLASALAELTQVVQVVIFHRPPPPADTSTTPVTGVTVGQVLGTQRRRTNKVPNNYQQSDL